MTVDFTLNGKPVAWEGPPITRLAAALRADLLHTGTKVGCDAGDCGACTVLLDHRQVCACLVAMGQVAGRTVETVEGLGDGNGTLAALQTSFLAHGAAQCGICTPGMLMAAQELLARTARPTRGEVEDALGGVLCRCTGYGKIVDAVMDARASLPAAPPAGGAVGSRLARVDGIDQAFGPREVRRRWRSRRCAVDPRRPLALCAGPLHLGRPRSAAPAARRGADGGRRAVERFRHLSRHQGPAGAGRRPGALSRRGRRRPGRRARRRAGDPRRRRADHLDAGAAGCRPRCRDGSRCAPGAGRQAAQSPAGGRRETRQDGRSLRDLRRGGRGRVRDRLRRARLYRARGRLGRAGGRSHRNPCLDPDALHGPRRGGDRHAAAARGGAHRADGLRRRLRRQARPLGPAPGGGGGVEASPAGRPGLHAAGKHGGLDQAPSRAHRRQVRLRCRGQAARLRGDSELRHRRLCLMGADRRQPRAGARHGPLPRAQRAHLGRCLVHQRPAVRRLPRLRRAAGRHRPRGDDGRAGRHARHRSPGVPPAQCAARRRHHGDRPDAGPFRRPRPVPGSAAAALAQGAGRDRRVQCSRRSQAARRRRGLHVVRHRQYLDVQPVVHAGRPVAGRHADALQRRGRYRPGLQHHHDPDRGRCAGPAGSAIRSGRGRHRSHPRCRQDLGLAPDLRLRHGGRARRPRPAPTDPAPGQCRAGGGAVARRRQAHGARRRRGARDRSRAQRVR